MDAWYQDEIHDPFTLQHEDASAGALVIHGFTGSPYDVSAVAETVHRHDIDVRVMQLPGMARDILSLNEMTGAVWRDAVRSEWASIADRYERTLLIGYSLGGALAILQAIEQSPGAMMLIAPLTRLPSRLADFLPIGKYFVKDVNIYERTDWTNDAVHDWYAAVRPGLNTRDPEVQRLLTEEASFSTTMLDEMRALCVDVRRQARQVTCPTLILQGTDDRVVLPRYTRELIRVIGGQLQYVELPGQHYIPLPGSPELPLLQSFLDDYLRRFMESAS